MGKLDTAGSMGDYKRMKPLGVKFLGEPQSGTVGTAGLKTHPLAHRAHASNWGFKRDEPGFVPWQWPAPSRSPYKPDTPVGFYRPTVRALVNELLSHSSPSISDRKARRPRLESSNRTVGTYAILHANPVVL